MMILELDDEIGQAIKNFAESEHKNVGQLVRDVLTDFLEDYYDTSAALAVMSRIENGEESVLTLDEVEHSLDAVDN